VAPETLDGRLAAEREGARRREQVAELKRLISAENHRQDALRIIRDMAALVEPPKLSPAPAAPKRAPRHTTGLVTYARST
jgi:hypothetical protein